MIEALIGFAALFILILNGMPIAFAMGLVGFAGFGMHIGWSPSLALVGQTVYETGLAYGLSVVPLFILMGNFVASSKLSEELYEASHSFLGHLPGGLAMATIVACGGFSAVCGSSLATAATMSRVAIPSMRKFGYDDSLATGSVAAGGTLGILIPPSVLMVIYGIMTNTDIGKLFIAGILPGLLGILLYITAIYLRAKISPELAPLVARKDWYSRVAALRGVWGVVLLFALVIGGIYGGVFTPTEAGGIGATGALLIALARRSLSWRSLIAVLTETARNTAMIFVILMGAMLFSHFIDITGMPAQLSAWILDLDVSGWVIVAAIILVYIVLGCILESLSMILLTVPVFFPIIAGLEFDPVWFGIIIVVITEISLITPPVGLNVFVLSSVLPDIKTSTIFRGIVPFLAADIVRLLLLFSIPAISLLLPSMMQ